jgi:hypothetical protein
MFKVATDLVTNVSRPHESGSNRQELRAVILHYCACELCLLLVTSGQTNLGLILRVIMQKTKLDYVSKVKRIFYLLSIYINVVTYFV